MKIAIFKNLEHGFETVHNDGLELSATYVRVTDYVDIDFPRLSDSVVVVEAQIAALNKAETELRSKFQHRLGEIDSARANLRAMTHTVQP